MNRSITRKLTFYLFLKKMGQDLSYNLYSEILFLKVLSRSNKTGNPGQLWRNAKQL